MQISHKVCIEYNNEYEPNGEITAYDIGIYIVYSLWSVSNGPQRTECYISILSAVINKVKTTFTLRALIRQMLVYKRNTKLKLNMMLAIIAYQTCQ